jgi:hypothetical protein
MAFAGKRQGFNAEKQRRRENIREKIEKTFEVRGCCGVDAD